MTVSSQEQRVKQFSGATADTVTTGYAQNEPKQTNRIVQPVQCPGGTKRPAPERVVKVISVTYRRMWRRVRHHTLPCLVILPEQYALYRALPPSFVVTAPEETLLAHSNVKLNKK